MIELELDCDVQRKSRHLHLNPKGIQINSNEDESVIASLSGNKSDSGYLHEANQSGGKHFNKLPSIYLHEDEDADRISVHSNMNEDVRMDTASKPEKSPKRGFFERIGLKKKHQRPNSESNLQQYHSRLTDEEEDEHIDAVEDNDDDEDDEDDMSSCTSEEEGNVPQISVSTPTSVSNRPSSLQQSNSFSSGKYIKTKTKHKKSDQEFSRLMLAQSIQTCHKSDLASSGPSNKHEYTNHYRMASDSSTEPSPNHPYGAIWVLKFSKDGCYLASGGQNCVVYLWKLLDQNMQDVPEYSINVLEEKPHMEYIGHKADVLDLAWSKHLNFVTSIEFHPKDDRFFLSGSMDGRIRIWSIPEKRVAFWNEIPGNRLVTAAGFTLDGKTVVAGSHDGHCYFFETQSLKYITQICVNSDMTSNRNSSSKKGPKITGIEMMPGMAPGDEKLLVTSNDSKARLFNMKDKSLMFKYKGAENTCLQIKAAFSDDGRHIISGSEDCHTYIWRTEQSSVTPLHHWHESRNKALSVFGHVGESTMSFPTAARHFDNHSSPALQRNDPLPASAKHNQQQTRFSKWLKKRDDPTDKIRSRTEYFEAHDYVVTAAIFAPAKTRQHIAKSKQDAIYNNRPIHLQRLPTASSGGSHSSASFVDDDQYSEGHILITADFRGLIKVWRIDSGAYGNQQNISTTLQIDTQSLHPSLAPSDLSTTSLSGSGARSISSPSPKVRKNFGIFSPRHAKQ
ncbi:hypothetical protein [Parasitella parasitica]|uniref:Uncharacterized protein n=1 Tax=Parasitella parasitica TaxID=35722 RepID=A0A0B7N303_9FUNG|nr:hypothetical protein [Parasitella parasitica]